MRTSASTPPAIQAPPGAIERDCDATETPNGRHAEGGALAPTALLVAAALAVGSFVPIVRDALVASRLGASAASDAYFLSTYIVIMLVTIFVSESSAPAAVVTLASHADAPVAEAGVAWPYWRVLAVAGCGLAVLAALLALLARPLVDLLAPGFDQLAVD